MAVSYPLALRTIIRASKVRTQPAGFGVAEPRRGPAYFQDTGTDVPVFWEVLFRFTTEEAQRFWSWFDHNLMRGALWFTLPIRTEFGLAEHECHFMPDGLLPVREVGELWEYTATITSRRLLSPDGSIYVELSNAGFNNNGATSAVGTLVRNLDPATTYILSLPQYKAFTGVSYWPSDTSTISGFPPAGQYWGNRVFVTDATVSDQGPGGANTYAFGTATGYPDGESARLAFPGGTITGSSSYKFWFYDPNPGDNRGGLSLKLTPASAANVNAPFYIPSADSGFASFVKLMMRMQGADGAGGAVDSSASPLTLTTVGVTHTTADAIFARTSLLFPASGDNYVSAPYASPLHIGSADFMVRARVKLVSATAADMCILSLWLEPTNKSWIFGINAAREVFFYTSTDGSTGDFSKFTSGHTVPLNTWTEVAAWRLGGRLRMAIGGIVRYDQANTQTLYTPSGGSNLLIVGAHQVASGPKAAPLRNTYLGELQLRIDDGGLYTGDYTPSTYALPAAVASAGPA